jgi:hypothetical protein
MSIACLFNCSADWGLGVLGRGDAAEIHGKSGVSQRQPITPAPTPSRALRPSQISLPPPIFPPTINSPIFPTVSPVTTTISAPLPTPGEESSMDAPPPKRQKTEWKKVTLHPNGSQQRDPVEKLIKVSEFAVSEGRSFCDSLIVVDDPVTDLHRKS